MRALCSTVSCLRSVKYPRNDRTWCACYSVDGKYFRSAMSHVLLLGAIRKQHHHPHTPNINVAFMVPSRHAQKKFNTHNNIEIRGWGGERGNINFLCVGGGRKQSHRCGTTKILSTHGTPDHAQPPKNNRL